MPMVRRIGHHSTGNRTLPPVKSWGIARNLSVAIVPAGQECASVPGFNIRVDGNLLDPHRAAGLEQYMPLLSGRPFGHPFAA